MKLKDTVINEIARKEAEEYFKNYSDLGITRKDVLECEDFQLPETKDILLEMLETRIVKKSNSEDTYTWGMDELDSVITTPKKGQVFLLAANEGNGKTTFCFYVARKNNEKYKHNVTYLSLEATKEELYKNIALSYAGVTKLEYRNESYRDNPLYQKKMDLLSKDNSVNIIGKTADKGSSISDIKKYVSEQEQIDFLIIDNLSCIQLQDGHYNENEATKQIMQELIGIAQNGGFPIILICHYRKQAQGKKKVFRDTSDISGSRFLKDLASGVIQVGRTIDPSDDPVSLSEFHIKEGKIRIGGTFNTKTIYFYKGDFLVEYPYN